MDAFDLNIDNYTIDELEDFFMLGRSAGVPIYDTGNVDQKRSMLLNKLTSDPSLPPSLKIGIKTFLEQAGQHFYHSTRLLMPWVGPRPLRRPN